MWLHLLNVGSFCNKKNILPIDSYILQSSLAILAELSLQDSTLSMDVRISQLCGEFWILV